MRYEERLIFQKKKNRETAVCEGWPTFVTTSGTIYGGVICPIVHNITLLNTFNSPLSYSDQPSHLTDLELLQLNKSFSLLLGRA